MRQKGAEKSLLHSADLVVECAAHGTQVKVERSMMGLKGREVVRNEDLHRIWHEAR